MVKVVEAVAESGVGTIVAVESDIKIWVEDRVKNWKSRPLKFSRLNHDELL